MSEPRRISLEEAIDIVDGGLVTRAVTEEVRAAWRVCRGELRRRRSSGTGAMAKIETELQRGRELAGLEEP